MIRMSVILLVKMNKIFVNVDAIQVNENSPDERFSHPGCGQAWLFFRERALK